MTPLSVKTDQNNKTDFYQYLPGLGALLPDLDLIICDLWGVMHDGVALNDPAVKAIAAARDAGVKTVFLSNAPRPRRTVADQLLSMGMPQSLTDLIVTSGGLARDHIRRDHSASRLYHLGPESDQDILHDLPVTLVDHPSSADVILASGLNFPEIEDHRTYLSEAARAGVPFLCANPDKVVHVGHQLIPCVGAIGDLYQEMGGPAFFYGKPETFAFQACFEVVGVNAHQRQNRVLMIGDSARTDIAGAAKVSILSLLITGGIHRDHFPADETIVSAKELRKRLNPHTAMPTYLMHQLLL